MMIRFFTSLAFLLLTTIILQAQDMYKVTADKLNVRQTNDKTSKIIGFVPQNENVMVLDSSDAKYFKIKVSNGEGWVSSEFLTRISKAPVKPAATIAPQATTPTSSTNNKQLIFFVVAGLVMATALYLTFKYLGNHKFLAAFTIIGLLGICYMSYTSFIKQKNVNGLFTSDSDTQYQTFDFKGKDSVVVKDVYADSLFTAHYTINGDVIKLKQQENIILLIIRDEKTLIGEGFTKGVFNKN
ncbi:MAG: SH3 domain-containing protein [Pedobacter sp.]|nr:MAG: SH3 domain-containing protein [Pedobacter sp.]